MKKLLVLAGLILSFVTATAQFPSTDSIRRKVNIDVRNSAVQAFTNLRLNTILIGMLDWIDSARLGEGGSLGIDTVYALNDSTARYVKNGVPRTFTLKGVYDNRRKVDSLYTLNDSMLRVKINGQNRDILIRGAAYTHRGVDTLYKSNDTTVIYTINGVPYSIVVGAGSSSGGITAEYLDSVISQIPTGSISVGYGFDGTGVFGDEYKADTAEYHNGLVTRFKLYQLGDSIIDLIANAGGLSSVSHDGSMYGSGTPGSLLGVDSLKFVTWYKMYITLDSLAAAFNAASFPQVFAGSGISVVTDVNGDYIVTCTGCSAGSNPLNARSIKEFGGIADAVVPVTGNVVTGTNNSTALQSMINALGDGQFGVVPDGKWLFPTVLDTIKGPKKFNLLILGDTYHNGADFLIFMNASGGVDAHTVVHMGYCIGRVNVPTHSQATHDAGTGPPWASFTGCPFKIYNTAQIKIEANRIEGFKSAFELIGNDYDNSTRGCYENSLSARWLLRNAVGIRMTSLNGRSYVNQNVFEGPGGGTMRITGGLAISIDGHSGLAPNGENWNGAFRNNRFHLVVEGVDSLMDANGDITENDFNITIEQGNYSTHGYRIRSVAPNYGRGNIFHGQGFVEENRILEGMGLDSRIEQPIWNSNAGRKYSNMDSEIDGSGNIVIRGSNLTAAQRTASPAIFKFASGGYAEVYKSITSSTYTAAPGEVIVYNNASGTGTNPSASTNIGKRITWVNINANALAISNASLVTSIPSGNVVTYLSNGTVWYPESYLPGSGGGGGGGGPFTSDAAGYTTGSKLGIGTASSSSTWMRFLGSTTGVSSRRMLSGTAPTAPADGDEWRVGARRFNAYGSIVFEDLMVPDNGLAGQIVRRNAANNGYEHAYQSKVFYTNTSTIVATGASSGAKTSLFGVAQAIDPLSTGDIIEITGSGLISTASSGTPSPTFDITLSAATNIFSTPTLAINKIYIYNYFIRIVAGGNLFLKLEISENGLSGSLPPVVYYSTGGTTGLNLSTPSVNVRAWFTNSGNLLNADVSTIEVKRK